MALKENFIVRKDFDPTLHLGGQNKLCQKTSQNEILRERHKIWFCGVLFSSLLACQVVNLYKSFFTWYQCYLIFRTVAFNSEYVEVWHVIRIHSAGLQSWNVPQIWHRVLSLCASPLLIYVKLKTTSDRQVFVIGSWEFDYFWYEDSIFSIVFALGSIYLEITV